MAFSAEDIIRQEIREQRKELKNLKSDDLRSDDVLLNQDRKVYNNWAQVKRSEALTKYYDYISDGLDRNKNDKDFLYSLIGFLDKPLSFDFSSACSDNSVLTAISIWILDALSLSGKLSEAVKYIPNDIELLRKVEILSFEHPSYDHYLIKGLVYLLKNRDEGLLSENGISNNIIHQKNKNIVIKDMEQEYPMRFHYESLISLIDKDIIEQSVSNFSDDISAVLEKYYALRDEVYEEINRIERNTPILSESDKDNPLVIKRDNTVSMSGRHVKLRYQWDNYVDSIICGYQIPELKNSNKKKFSASEEIENYNVADPYETLFAVFYMFDNDYQLPWLFNATVLIINRAKSQLPFLSLPYIKNNKSVFKTSRSIYENVYPKFSVFDYMDEEMDEENYKEMMLDLTNDLLGLSIRMSATEDEDEDYLFEDDEEIEDNDDNYIKYAENLAQKIYSYTGVVYPRVAKICDRNSYNDFIDKLEADENISKRELAELLIHVLSSDERHYLDTAYSGAYDSYTDIDDVSSDEISVDEYKEKISIQKKQISDLKRSLHSEIKELSDLNAKYEESLNNEKAFLQELKDLREIVFNINSGVTEKEDKEADVSFPVRLSERKVISFGGHESWINSMKEYLPDVKFVSPNVVPNTELIRNADEIWFQTNCMSHSFFYKIINIAKEYKKTIRYYKFSGAGKCAMQMLEAYKP